MHVMVWTVCSRGSKVLPFADHIFPQAYKSCEKYLILFCFVLFCLVSFIQIRLFSFKSNPSQSMSQNKQIKEILSGMLIYYLNILFTD